MTIHRPPVIACELWGLVFDYVTEFDPKSSSSNAVMLRLGHVCKTWRAICRSQASLWTSVVVDLSRNDAAQLQNHIQLSKNLPLTVAVIVFHALDGRNPILQILRDTLTR